MDKEFEYIDELLESISNKGVETDDPIHKAEVDCAVLNINKALAGSAKNYSIRISTNELKSHVLLEIEADNIVFSDVKRLFIATTHIENVEICPLPNGRVRMGFSFSRYR